MSKKDKVKKKSHFKIDDEREIIYNQKDVLERNADYFSSLIQKDLMSRTMKNGDDVIVDLSTGGCNLFLDGPGNVPEYYYVSFKDIFGGRSRICIKNILFRNIDIDEVIEKEVVPLMAVAIYHFSDGNKKYGILENEAKSEYLFFTFDKIFQKIKEMLENERLSIQDFEYFKKLFEITLENQLEHYPDAKEKLLKMENIISIVGLDQEIVNKMEEYKEEQARKKKELEAILGHEVDEDTFYLFEMAKEHEYEKGRIEKAREMIFKMFAEGLDDETISRCSTGYFVEDIAALRKKWLEKVSAEKSD